MIHIGRAGTKLGVFSEDEIREGLKTGRFFSSDLGWREGMENWTPLSGFAGLAEAPPLPPEPGHAEAWPHAEVPLALLPGLPWDERQAMGWARAFIETAQMVLINPGEAFTRMRKEGPLSGPLLYNLLGVWIGLAANCAWNFLLSRLKQPDYDQDWMRQLFTLTPARARHQLEIVILMGPIIATAGALVSALIWHLLLMITGAANKAYHVTLRVTCFAHGSAQLLQIIPGLGGLIAPVWVLVCCIIGFARAHEASTARTLVAAGIAFISIILCCAGLFLLAYSSLSMRAAGTH